MPVESSVLGLWLRNSDYLFHNAEVRCIIHIQMMIHMCAAVKYKAHIYTSKSKFDKPEWWPWPEFNAIMLNKADVAALQKLATQLLAMQVKRQVRLMLPPCCYCMP